MPRRKTLERLAYLELSKLDITVTLAELRAMIDAKVRDYRKSLKTPRSHH
jgi:hypothetical protein